MALKATYCKVLAGIVLSVILLSSFAPPGEDGLCDSPFVGGHTGAPGESSCTGCHAGTANTGSAVIDWSIGDAGTYVPGTQYTSTVKIKRVGREKFGFVCLALKDAGNVNLGGFGLVETVRTRTYMDGTRDYVSHTPCGADAQDSTEWSFTWQAPATDVGPITIYMANLVANHSHSTSGDETYTHTITLTPSALGINDIFADGSGLRAYPNPSTGFFQLGGATGLPADAVVDVFDATGRLVHSQLASTAITKGIDLGNVEDGVYPARMRGRSGSVLSLLVQH